MYEVTKHQRNDFDGPISSELVGRSMVFQSRNGQAMEFNEKELYGADLWIDDVTDAVTFTLDYRPDQHPEWQDWKVLNEIEPVGTCQAITCGGVPTIRKNFTPRKRIGKPGDACDSAWTKRWLRRGYEFQPRLRWTGHATIRKMRLHAQMETEIALGDCQ